MKVTLSIPHEGHHYKTSHAQYGAVWRPAQPELRDEILRFCSMPKRRRRSERGARIVLHVDLAQVPERARRAYRRHT